MTVCLCGRVKVLGEGVRPSSSSASATGNGEASKNGVAGATGTFLINRPANIREGMRANVPLDGLLKLRKITSFSFALHASRVGVMDRYSDPFPPDQADDHQICIKHKKVVRTAKEDANGLRKTGIKLEVFWVRTLKEFSLTCRLLTFDFLICAPLVAYLNYIQIRCFIQADKKLVELLGSTEITGGQITSETGLHNVYGDRNLDS